MSKYTKEFEPLKTIAYIENDFPTKFGVPRQSGLIDELEAIIRPISPYDVAQAFRGIEEYSHLWILWGFSKAQNKDWTPTVRPPRLGGNQRVGVFATRSPFRPNSIGLSSVKLLGVDFDDTNKCTGIRVAGADLMNGTPIFDIKPYLSFTDSHPDAVNGFADRTKDKTLQTIFPGHLRGILPPEKEQSLEKILSSDPRPSYQKDPNRIYGFPFDRYEIRFRVEKETVILLDIESVSDIKI